MKIHLSIAVLGLALVIPAQAETQPADCGMLASLVQGFTGYEVTAPPAGDAEGWCVMDGARLVAAAADQPDLKAETLRLRGLSEDGQVVSVELQTTGLRLVSGLGAKQVDEKLQAMFRLQSADLHLGLGLNAAEERVEVREMNLELSGGTVLRMDADLAGAGLSPLGLAVGRLTMLELEWQSDGRLLRGVMEAVGTGMDDALTGSEAIGVAREGLETVIAALPTTLMSEESRRALSGMAASLPEGRGVLQLSFASDDGIGAADLLVAGMADEPLAATTLAELFATSRLQANWAKGLQP